MAANMNTMNTNSMSNVHTMNTNAEQKLNTSAEERAQMSTRFAEQKLSLSMPRAAVYPQCWTDAVRDMRHDFLAEVVQVLADSNATPRQWEAAANRFLNHIRANNRKAAKKAKQAKKMHMVVGGGAAAPELTESEKASALVLQQRRQVYLQDMLTLLAQ